MRRIRIVALLLALSGPLLVGVGAVPAAADTQVTATTAVNVRSAPSTSGRIVGGLYRGQTVAAVSAAQGWTKIRYARSVAYVASRYLVRGSTLPSQSSVNSGSVRVATTDVNLRRGPGQSYAVITVLKKGTEVRLSGKSARGYAEVRAGSRTGWIATQYLAQKSGLPKIVGVRVATADLLIRTTSGADARTVGEVPKGTRLSITGTTQNGRAQIIYRNAVRWVTAKYLANPTANQPSVPGLPAVKGYRYATADLLVRSTSGSDYTVITEVAKGTKLAITGVERNGRAQIIWAKAARWVTAKYLSKTPPAAGGGSGTGYAAVERGLQPNTIRLHRAVRAEFPQITTVYGVRRDPIPDHPSGLALDFMIPNYKSASGRDLGFRLARWSQANASRLRISYIIWDQRIWNVRRAGEGWRFMADRGGDSANHKNHVHITVFR